MPTVFIQPNPPSDDDDDMQRDSPSYGNDKG